MPRDKWLCARYWAAILLVILSSLLLVALLASAPTNAQSAQPQLTMTPVAFPDGSYLPIMARAEGESTPQPTPETATLTGKNFVDEDGDETLDENEPGLAGSSVYVDYNENGEMDPQEPATGGDAAGDFFIDNITPGTHQVRVKAPSGWQCTIPATSDDSGCYYELTFKAGKVVADVLFAHEPVAVPSSISGMKYRDLNKNGGKDEGEPGLEGWAIFVDYDEDTVHDAGEPFAMTGIDGSYLIEAVKPGTHLLREITHRGWECTQPADCQYEVTFTSGEVYVDKDFGNWAPGSVSGRNWYDSNNNGIWDDGERGLDGWTIFVDGDGGPANGELDPGEPYALTDENGAYTIIPVSSGERLITELVKPEWTCTSPTGCAHQRTLNTGDDLSGLNFGNHTSSLSTYPWIPFGETFTGDGTFYWEATGEGNCTLAALPEGERMVGALNQEQYIDSNLCGAYAWVNGPAGSVLVQIVDRCPECFPGDIDLSPEAFAKIVPDKYPIISWGRVEIRWQLVSPPLDGPIVYHFHPAANPYWMAIQIRNHRNPVVKVELQRENGQWLELQRQDWNYFITHEYVGNEPYTVRVTDLFGNILTDSGMVLDPGGSIDGIGQFPAP